MDYRDLDLLQRQRVRGYRNLSREHYPDFTRVMEELMATLPKEGNFVQEGIQGKSQTPNKPKWLRCASS